jgi:putative ABC transport system permease protein
VKRAINKKLLRDLRHMLGQIVATSIVVACGIASFVAMRSTYASLVSSQESYYAEYRFGDVFASLKRAPDSVAARIAAIPGVAEVQTRVVRGVSLSIPGVAEPAQARLISIPPHEQAILNDLHLVRGSYIASGSGAEVIVSEGFANANAFEPGDQIEVNLNGRRRRLTIAGVALSPEHIYEIRPGDIYPDSRRFGIIWISRIEIASAFQMTGAFDDVSVRLAPGAHTAAVIASLDSILAEFGGLGAYDRSEQLSYRFISNELSQLQAFGLFLPLTFLSVTGFLLHLVLSRVVQTQREQIGLLKAFGYTGRRIAAHYLLMATACVISGSVIGVAAGSWLGYEMTLLYAEYFHFPVLQFRVGVPLLASALLIGLAAAAVGATSALVRVLRLPPAESMRPESPPSFSSGFVENFGLTLRFSPAGRMTLRNLVRQGFKSLMAVGGIALAASLLFTGFYFSDAIERVIDVQFGKAMHADMIISFTSPKPGRTRHEVLAMPGVHEATFFRAVPVRLRAGNRSKRTALQGIEHGNPLHRIVDKDGRIHQPPADGLLLSTALATRLDMDTGDEISVEVLEGKRQTKKLTVVDVVDEMVGTNAYLEISALNHLLDEDDVVSGAYLSVKSDRLDDLYSKLKASPSVAGVGLPGAALKGFEDTFARTIGTFTFFLVAFASAIVFGVVYNAARVALSERGRELASLRVLGFTRRETSRILLGEQAVLTVLAVPAGFLIGVLLCYLMNNLVDREMLRLPLVFSLRTVILTAAITATASLVSGLIVARKVKRLNMIEVLKTRE